MTNDQEKPTVSSPIERVVSAADTWIDFKKGGTFYFKGHKCHIVEMIECNMVVFKWYGKHKQWWHYQVEDADHIERIHKIELEKRLETKAH